MGIFGQIHPLTAQNYGVSAELYCAELQFDALFRTHGADPEYTPLPKFPAVIRDLALVCDEAITVAQLERCIAGAAGPLLRKINLFDIYRGAGVPDGKKSVAFSLELRSDDRTLTDEDSSAAIERVLQALQTELEAVLR